MTRETFPDLFNALTLLRDRLNAIVDVENASISDSLYDALDFDLNTCAQRLTNAYECDSDTL